jgi:hypothetical protein
MVANGGNNRVKGAYRYGHGEVCLLSQYTPVYITKFLPSAVVLAQIPIAAGLPRLNGNSFFGDTLQKQRMNGMMVQAVY